MPLPPYNESVVDSSYVPYSEETSHGPINRTESQVYEEAMYLSAVDPDETDPEAIKETINSGHTPKAREQYDMQKDEERRFQTLEQIDYYVNTGKMPPPMPQTNLEQDAVLTGLAEQVVISMPDGTQQAVSKIAYDDMFNNYQRISAMNEGLEKAYEQYNADGGLETFTDFVGSAFLPLNDWFTLTNAASEYTGKGFYINPWNAFIDMRDKYQSAILSGDPEAIRTAGTELYNILREHSGILDHNDLQAAMMYSASSQ